MNKLLTNLAALVPIFRDRAQALDEKARFPAENVADLHLAGAILAPFPARLGGSGAGCEIGGGRLAIQMLRSIGRGHLATGRLFEGHVNAVKLLALYGSGEQLEAAAQDALEGRMIGLWVTDGPEALLIKGGMLIGGKGFCSGAGFLDRAIVTAQMEDGEAVLVRVRIDNSGRAKPGLVRLAGLRSAVTGVVDLTGLPAERVGEPGDYLRQPSFSAGAWRTSAVTLGGLDTLVKLACIDLVARGRAGNAHQLDRIGRMLIAQQTASMWVERAARLAEEDIADPGDVAAGVNLARIAVERAVLDVIELVQRALGLSALRLGHPAELLMRDLATYLRQPAPDETLSEAAAWHTLREMPP